MDNYWVRKGSEEIMQCLIRYGICNKVEAHKLYQTQVRRELNLLWSWKHHQL